MHIQQTNQPCDQGSQDGERLVRRTFIRYTTAFLEKKRTPIDAL